MMETIQWKLAPFEELSTQELYRIMQARQEVFIVEQKCWYLDCDGKDAAALHLVGKCGEQLAAYCRILPPGKSFDEPSIGRVLTTNAFRRGGYGRALMIQAIKIARARYPTMAIRISAQQYLEGFYSLLGFKVVSEPYPEDDIPHIEMLFAAT